MSLQLYAYTDFLTAAENALATGSSVKFNNFKLGSAALALCESIAGNAISLQLLIQSVFNITRLGTSTGADVDSYLADFGLVRDPAVASSGSVTVGRNNTTAQVVVPATPIGTTGGALFQTKFTNIQFQVIPDNSNPNYSASLGGYVLASGVSAIQVTVQAVIPGSASNVLANTIVVLVSGTVGISSVSNGLPFENGSDTETDAQAKLRFQNFINGLSKANTSAISAAITSVQPNLTYQIIEGLDFNGATFTAGFIVVVDDGTGIIGLPLQQAILTALNSVRAAGVQCKVYAPTNQTINVAAHISVGSGFSPSVVQNSVAAAVQAKINGYGVGAGTLQKVALTDIENVIQTTPGVTAYSNVTLNGGTLDIGIALTQLPRMGLMTFV